jgi:hypothetical protein
VLAKMVAAPRANPRCRRGVPTVEGACKTSEGGVRGMIRGLPRLVTCSHTLTARSRSSSCARETDKFAPLKVVLKRLGETPLLTRKRLTFSSRRLDKSRL